MRFAWHSAHITNEWDSTRSPMLLSQKIVFLKAYFKSVRVKKLNSTKGIRFYVTIGTQEG